MFCRALGGQMAGGLVAGRTRGLHTVHSKAGLGGGGRESVGVALGKEGVRSGGVVCVAASRVGVA